MRISIYWDLWLNSQRRFREFPIECDLIRERLTGRVPNQPLDFTFAVNCRKPEVLGRRDDEMRQVAYGHHRRFAS